MDYLPGKITFLSANKKKVMLSKMLVQKQNLHEIL